MSHFQVSARKYRPSRFNEVVGQSHITDTLKNALKVDRLAHSFLFCGPRGVGKTTCARILAKAINCQNPGEDREPCNTCASCNSFNEHTSFNIIELDAASNNSVDDIRQLNDQVRFPPQQGNYKVFIIDEVHMLSQQAFNAFLKTLEEPPEYAVFILATTEKHKILPTILSRCQIFDFHRITVEDITEHLQGICGKENITAEEDGLRLIAAKADGALRDALSLFDRIATVSEEGITYKGVVSQLNLLDYDYFFKFTEAFINEDLEEVFLLFNEVLANGFDGDLFLVGLADHFRQLMVAIHPKTIDLIEGSAKLKERYLAQAKKVSKSFLLTGLSLINDCDVNYPLAQHKRLHVEICLSRITYMSRASRASSDDIAPKKKEVAEGESKKAKPKEIPSEQQQADTKEEKPAETPKAEPKQEAVEPPAKKSGIIPSIIPKIASTQDIQKEAQKAIADLPKHGEELSSHSLLEDWDKYVMRLSSASVKKLYESSEIELNGEVVIVRVVTQIAKDSLAQDDTFIQGLREKYHRSDLKVDIQIDEEKAAALKKETVKPLNAKEKFQLMVEKNPLLQKMRDDFDLIPDGEL